MNSSCLRLKNHFLLGILIICISQSAFGEIIQDVLAGSGTTCGLLRKYGYDCESHTVTTEDGYILNIFRVLCPNANITNSTSRPVAFLMHGLLCSSSIWTLSPETGLAMTMCDKGYDVWLGNARGNQYSKKHVKLSPLGPSFYKFSWAEIAAIDLPTMLNYTLDQTGQENLTYVGHSQGTTVFFAFASLFPSLAALLIKSAHLLSPVVYMTNIKGPIVKLATPILGLPDPASDVAEVQVLPKLFISNLLGKTVCENSDPTRLCENVMKILNGNSDKTNKTILPVVLTTYPAGSSLRQIKHYLQEKKSSKFCLYDFGVILNILKYGSRNPPEYPLKNINVPIFLYYSDSDYLAAVEDVERLIASLNPKIVIAAHKYSGYNHMDYIIAKNVKEDLHMHKFNIKLKRHGAEKKTA